MYRGEPPREYYLAAWAQYPIVAGTCRSFGPYLNMVNVHGATSTSRQTEWTSTAGKTPDGQPAFIKFNPMKVNDRMSDYIFGWSNMGTGYYHITTREAYKILYTHIDKRIENVKSDISMRMCMGRLVCACAVTGRKPSAVEELEEELSELQEMRDVAFARYYSKFPIGIVGPEWDENDTTKYLYYTSDGQWKFPEEFYDAGGGKKGFCTGVTIFYVD